MRVPFATSTAPALGKARLLVCCSFEVCVLLCDCDAYDHAAMILILAVQVDSHNAQGIGTNETGTRAGRVQTRTFETDENMQTKSLVVISTQVYALTCHAASGYCFCVEPKACARRLVIKGMNLPTKPVICVLHLNGSYVPMQSNTLTENTRAARMQAGRHSPWRHKESRSQHQAALTWALHRQWQQETALASKYSRTRN